MKGEEKKYWVPKDAVSASEEDNPANQVSDSAPTIPKEEEKEYPIFQNLVSGEGDAGVTGEGIDDVINASENFVSQGEDSKVSANNLQSFSAIFYNILLTIGVACVVITGMVIGIKYMIGSVEEKANYKQMLWPYLIGSIVTLSAFGLWKIVIEIMRIL